ADLLARMTETLTHRGPDDRGTWSDEERGIYLGHRRLSVLDLSAHGHQPVISRSGRYVLVYNGETYNHPALRGGLGRQKAGVVGDADLQQHGTHAAGRVAQGRRGRLQHRLRQPLESQAPEAVVARPEYLHVKLLQPPHAAVPTHPVEQLVDLFVVMLPAAADVLGVGDVVAVAHHAVEVAGLIRMGERAAGQLSRHHVHRQVLGILPVPLRIAAAQAGDGHEAGEHVRVREADVERRIAAHAVPGEKRPVAVDAEPLPRIPQRFEHDVMRGRVELVFRLLRRGVVRRDDDVAVPLRLARLLQRAAPPHQLVERFAALGVQRDDGGIDVVRGVLVRQQHRVTHRRLRIGLGHVHGECDTGLCVGRFDRRRKQRNHLGDPLRREAFQRTEAGQDVVSPDGIRLPQILADEKASVPQTPREVQVAHRMGAAHHPAGVRKSQLLFGRERLVGGELQESLQPLERLQVQLRLHRRPQRFDGGRDRGIGKLRLQLAQQQHRALDVLGPAAVVVHQLADFLEHRRAEPLGGKAVGRDVRQLMLSGSAPLTQIDEKLPSLKLTEFQNQLVHAGPQLGKVAGDRVQLLAGLQVQAGLQVEDGDRHPHVRVVLVGRLPQHRVELCLRDRGRRNGVFPLVVQRLDGEILRVDRLHALQDVERLPADREGDAAAAELVELGHLAKRADAGEHQLAGLLEVRRELEFLVGGDRLPVDAVDLPGRHEVPLHAGEHHQHGIVRGGAALVLLDGGAAEPLHRRRLALNDKAVLQADFVSGRRRDEAHRHQGEQPEWEVAGAHRGILHRRHGLSVPADPPRGRTAGAIGTAPMLYVPAVPPRCPAERRPRRPSGRCRRRGWSLTVRTGRSGTTREKPTDSGSWASDSQFVLGDSALDPDRRRPRPLAVLLGDDETITVGLVCGLVGELGLQPAVGNRHERPDAHRFGQPAPQVVGAAGVHECGERVLIARAIDLQHEPCGQRRFDLQRDGLRGGVAHRGIPGCQRSPGDDAVRAFNDLVRQILVVRNLRVACLLFRRDDGLPRKARFDAENRPLRKRQPRLPAHQPVFASPAPRHPQPPARSGR
ncbi:MAG: hypothetical protein KY476_24525, partial [Planctomycetes bacterium]|nr:hypothetical protein [Planctomycetota bacterium]